MGLWAQQPISVLNAPAGANPRHCAEECGEKRCLFPALNEATRKHPALSVRWQPRHFERSPRRPPTNPQTVSRLLAVQKLNALQPSLRSPTSSRTSRSPFSMPSSAALPAASSSEATARANATAAIARDSTRLRTRPVRTGTGAGTSSVSALARVSRLRRRRPRQREAQPGRAHDATLGGVCESPCSHSGSECRERCLRPRPGGQRRRARDT
jgi:hypothetical protein